MINDKIEIRRGIIEKRKGLTEKDEFDWSNAIQQKLISLKSFKKCGAILVYVAMRGEVGTLEVIRTAYEQGKTVVVPTVKKGEEMLRLSALSKGHINELLSEGINDDSEYWLRSRFGILEPIEGSVKEISPKEIDFIATPGLGFDRQGGRVGYGGGYYDRLIEKCDSSTSKVAVAFEFQILPQIPRFGHDQNVDMIITENEIIEI